MRFVCDLTFRSSTDNTCVAGLGSSSSPRLKKVGSLKPIEHGVKGDVYVVDGRTLLIKNFNYDGQAPGGSLA